MKRMVLILTMLLGAVLPLAAQKSTFAFTFNGLAAGERIVVSDAVGGRLVPSDTLVPDAKARVTVVRDITEPQMVVLALLQPKSPQLYVLMMPHERATASVDFMPAINFFNVTAAKGSANMELYRKYTNMASALLLDNQAQLLPDRLAALLDENAGVLMSAFLVTYFEQAFDQYAPLYRKIRDALIGEWPRSEFVQHIDSRLKSVLTVGDEAPDIELPDPEGNVRRLSDLRGKVVLIDFWASWCGPCRRESPNVVRAYNTWHDKGFEIFSVSLDNKREAWLQAIQQDGLLWPNHVSDLRGWSSAGGRLYGIQSIPATVLVGPDGKILARNLRGGDLEKKLKEILE